MASRSDTVTIEVELPRPEYERLMREAKRERITISEAVPSLIAAGLDSRLSSREIMERVAADYQSRLAGSGARELSPDDVLEKLRRDREEIVNELYP